jgi:hypothetical protein
MKILLFSAGMYLNIKRRITTFHLNAKNIAEDFAKKVGKRIVDEAIKMNANVIMLEKQKI